MVPSNPENSMMTKKFKFGGNLAGTRQKSTVVHAKLPVFYLLLEYYVQIILKPCFNAFFLSSSVIKYFHKKQVTSVFISISNIYIYVQSKYKK